MDKINRGLIIEKRNYNDQPHAVVMNCEKDVYISEEEIYSNQEHDPIGNLIGVEVDYMITEERDDFFIGSRKSAMELQAKTEIKIGDKVNLSIIKVKERYLIGSAAGREVMIPAQRISEQWVNLNKHFKTNDQFEGIVRKIEPLEIDLHHLRLGNEIDISNFEVNQEFLAEVISVLTSGIVVQLIGKKNVTVMCRTVNWQHQPMVDEKVVISLVSIDEKRLYGYIKRRV